MGCNFLRNVSKWSRLRVHETRLFIAHVGSFTAEAQCLSKHQQWRAYARFPTQPSKTRGANTSSSPSRPCSSSPSSSASSHSSYSKAAFVGWYLGKLESWPLITKCISSSLIYTAADLTSQMITLPPSGSFDKAIYGPSITTVFFSYNAGLQGESGQEIVGRLKRDLLPTLKNGVLYWPICDFVTFKFIPVHLQPLVNSSCSYVWTVYLTYMASLKKASNN
ncbi:uncharacterized protein LOC133871346 isoform X2 [Alnus glutinosa]|uniref:uncharacterized protein LOC133871346 isoform X2 n=1 Tax=Alnus glutinosa TaxID=3517 RepID=UPI002D794810|nr:uncharacterized protein LOC133871346 isoform X2 [Alnus glutinosa]